MLVTPLRQRLISIKRTFGEEDRCFLDLLVKCEILPLLSEGRYFLRLFLLRTLLY